MLTETEMNRIDSKKSQILKVLRNAGKDGVTNERLSKVSLRYGGCLGMLYQEGYRIDKEALGDGLYQYVLVSEPKEKPIHIKAMDRLIAEVSDLGSVTSEQLFQLMENNNISVKYKANTYNT